MNRLPANQKHRPHGQRWQRDQKPQPGHRLQMDVKFLERIPGTQKRLYQFTAIDDCTRLRVLKVYDACNQRTAIRFADEVMRRLPFRVQVVQTDNGAEFQSQFHWHLEGRDIRHVYIRPRTPHLNGKVERSHRVDLGGHLKTGQSWTGQNRPPRAWRPRQCFLLYDVLQTQGAKAGSCPVCLLA